MQGLKFAKPERLWLEQHPDFREASVQDQIADDLSILGLGALILKDKERIQTQAGRVDFMDYDVRGERNHLRLERDEVKKYEVFFKRLLRKSYEHLRSQ